MLSADEPEFPGAGLDELVSAPASLKDGDDGGTVTVEVYQHSVQLGCPTSNHHDCTMTECWMKDIKEGFKHLGWDENRPHWVTILPVLHTDEAKFFFRTLPEEVQN